MTSFYESVPYSVVSSLLNNLNNLSSTDFGKSYGVADLLENIQSNIRNIESTLLDVDRKRDGDIVQWLRRSKPLLLAADDLFDDIATDNLLLPNPQLSVRRKVLHFFSSLNPLAHRLRIVPELIVTQKKVNDIVEGMRGLKLSQGHASLLRATATTSDIFDDAIIVGREEDKWVIIEQLMQQGGEENLGVIGIVGMGGIGKTTLAQLVFNDHQVIEFFQKRVWVGVSDYDFDVQVIVKNILQSLITTGYKGGSFQQDLDLLHQNLNGTRYLLVLDDVWNESLEKWNDLASYLMCGAQGSKILLTTRSERVAHLMDATLYHVSCLSEKESFDLLKRLAFKNDEYLMSHTLDSVAKEISRKCVGHPLTIRCIAGVLRYKSKSEWINVLEHDIWKMELGYDKDILPVLRISYDFLPCQLKECFSYCSLYPMGWEIEKNELIQSWMAQGYLQCLNDEQQQMEDLGNEFVNTLLKMSFFVHEKLDEYGNLVSFEMHDLIHDLACFVARTDFCFDPLRRDINHVHMSLPLKSYNNIGLSANLDSSRLRTFFLQQENVREFARNTKELSAIFICKRLRLLNLSKTSLAVLPYSIGKLKHLRYLNLSWCLKLTSLPKSIGNLVNLQTLKLTGCERLNFSTEVITRLTNLRHLEIHRCKAFEDMMPAGLGKLSSLQSLSNFHVVDDKKKKAGKLNELQNLNSLRGNLEINALDQVKDAMKESQFVNMKEKNLLESLDLNWENQDNIVADSFKLLENLCPHNNLKRLHVRWYPGDQFTDWLSSTNHLTHISLFGFNNCKSLPPIENLPNLKSLEIGSMKVLECIYFKVVSSTAPATFFKSLERLKLSGCKNFTGWKMIEGESNLDHPSSQHQFRCLSQLIINKCPKLIELPTFPNVNDFQLCESMVKSSSFSTPLSNLKSLKIEGKLPDINSDLPSQWKRNLTSLEHLEIGDVDNLDIWFEDEFPSLQKVVIYGCDLKALPSKMCHLLSLKHIKMMGCHNLESLPKEMVQLTKLVTLDIWDCPLLVERCQKETGVDWPQISHIRNIILRQNLRR